MLSLLEEINIIQLFCTLNDFIIYLTVVASASVLCNQYQVEAIQSDDDIHIDLLRRMTKCCIIYLSFDSRTRASFTSFAGQNSINRFTCSYRVDNSELIKKQHFNTV